jgi:hypothetical protein
VVVLGRMMMLLLLLLLHLPLLEVGWRGYCGGTGRARGGGAAAPIPEDVPARSCAAAAAVTLMSLVRSLVAFINEWIMLAETMDQSPSPPPSSSSSSSLPMVVVVRLLLPPRRGAAVHRRRRHIHGGRGREQRHQLVDLRVHSSLEGDAPCHLPFQLVHARQEAPTVSCPSSSHTRCSSTTSSLFFVMSSSRRRLNIAWRE